MSELNPRHLHPEAATCHPERCLSHLHFCTGAPLRFAPLHGIFAYLANWPTGQPVN